MKKLYACSSNAGKMAEFQLIATEAGLAGYEFAPLPSLSDITPPEETGASFEENAALKACYYSGFTTELVLADDSGLEVQALNCAPGIFSARYAGPNASDEQNNSLVLERMQGKSDRRARFVCAIAVAQAGEILQTALGTVEGQLLMAAKGTGGFGYDPLFFYPDFQCSFGEVTRDRKLTVSHRGNALRQIVRKLATP